MRNQIYEKWDVHHHILPDFYVEELKSLGVTNAGGVKWPKWSPEQSLKVMKQFGITKAFLSLSAPGVFFKDKEYSRSLARRCNEYIAGLTYKYPRKFGAFAFLPLPDVEGSLAELEYALDELKLDGVVLLTNVDDHFLGDKSYRPLFEEMNKRNTTVFIHVNTRNDMNELGLLNGFYWWYINTTKTLMEMVKSGYHRDFPNINYIPAHGAGVLPAVFSKLVESLKPQNPNIEAELEAFKSQLYLDTAKSANEYALPGVLGFADSSHVVFGTDYMWARTSNINHWINTINSFDINDPLRKDIYLSNAKTLMENNTRKKGKEINYPQIDYLKRNTGGVKYHYHTIPTKTAEKLKKIEITVDKDALWNEEKALAFKSTNNYSKLMLSFDAPEVWSLKDKNVETILRSFNDEAAKISANSQSIGALGAIDTGKPELAVKEIDRCINQLKMDGLCLYVDIFETPADYTLSEKIFEKLKTLDVPIMIHPKHHDGVPTDNEHYFDSVYFLAKIFYSGEISAIEEKKLVFTHTGGILLYLAESIGLFYYMQHKKWHLGKLSFDYIVKKKLRGTELIENAIIDD